MNAEAAIRQLRRHAINMIVGYDIGADRLIRAGLDALRGIGGDLIWHHGWSDLDHPETLLPLVGEAVAYDDHVSSYAIWDTDRQATTATHAGRITDEARKLINQPWPPQHGTETACG